MAKITFKGTPVNTVGNLPAIGSQVPDFTVTKTDLTETSLKDYAGHKLILNIFPSLDTGTCAMSVRHFNEAASQLNGTKVLCISADLPFAQKRFCGAENLTNVTPASVFRHSDFGKKFGVTLLDSPLAGLLSRAVVVVDEKGKVIYTQQVPEIVDEPNYDAALAAIK